MVGYPIACPEFFKRKKRKKKYTQKTQNEYIGHCIFCGFCAHSFATFAIKSAPSYKVQNTSLAQHLAND
jgi:formate hydrogenlyase subunit 6/NADH:ubiquinone oxidoreductase subunit I